MSARGSLPFGTLLRSYRLGAGLTHEELAEKARLSARAISALERGERLHPRPVTVRLLAAALGLDPVKAVALQRAGQSQSALMAQEIRAEPVSDTETWRVSRATSERRASLPTPLTSFVGRQREVGDVDYLLAHFRLVTLTGPPGVGKTRLAQVIAADLADDGIDVRFVSLEAIRDPELVLAILAQAARVEGFEHQPLVDVLVEVLRGAHAVFVLDNFEQVVAAAPLVSRLLQGCAGLRFLITSRVRLNVRGEREYVLAPLPVPGPPASVLTPTDLATAVDQSEAGRLFLDRARETCPELCVDRDSGAAIVEICRRLDGLPLAIELAAARCKLLAPPAILARLPERFDLLNAGPVDLPPHQQTLRGAIAWSHDLLDAEDRALFRRLSIFAGGFTLVAAEAICGGTLDRIAALVDQSLVQRETAGAVDAAREPRFRMLETIREFAREQLVATGEVDALGRSHASYFLALADRGLPGADLWTAPGLERFEREYGNMRAALRFVIDHGTMDVVSGLSALLLFWMRGGYLNEARVWLSELLELTVDPGWSAVRANLLLACARMAFKQSDNLEASRRLDESLAAFRALDDRRALAAALGIAGLIARWQGQYDRAIDRFEEAAGISRALGDRAGVALTRDFLGLTTFWKGDVARGRALLEEALAEWRALGLPSQEGNVLHNLGVVAHGQEDYVVAKDYLDRSLAIARSRVFRLGIAEALGDRGDLALDLDDLDAARADLRDSLLIHRDLGNRREIAHVLECFASLAARRDDRERAVRLWAAGASLRDAIGEPRPPDQAVRVNRRLQPLRAVLNDEDFARAWVAGQALTVPDAIAQALESDST